MFTSLEAKNAVCVHLQSGSRCFLRFTEDISNLIVFSFSISKRIRNRTSWVSREERVEERPQKIYRIDEWHSYPQQKPYLLSLFVIGSPRVVSSLSSSLNPRVDFYLILTLRTRLSAVNPLANQTFSDLFQMLLFDRIVKYMLIFQHLYSWMWLSDYINESENLYLI